MDKSKFDFREKLPQAVKLLEESKIDITPLVQDKNYEIDGDDLFIIGMAIYDSNRHIRALTKLCQELARRRQLLFEEKNRQSQKLRQTSGDSSRVRKRTRSE